MTTPVQVYDRIYLSHPDKLLVIEYIDGYCDVLEKWLDEWRLIDLNTGEVFEKDPLPHTVLGAASNMAVGVHNIKPHGYVVEVSKTPELRKFDDIPLKDKLRHVQSHAQDLEHDFVLEGNKACPLAAALVDYQQRYNDEPCFFQNETGEWEIHESCY